MEPELNIAARITSELIDRYISDWKPRSKLDGKPARENYQSEAFLRSELRIKITITHIEQAKNAFRMGKIDQVRFDRTVQRLTQRGNEDSEIVRMINEFIDAHGFAMNISDMALARKISKPTVIPFPQFNQDRFEFLWDEQKWEYVSAFSNKDSGHLFSKYYIVRTQEILLGLIKNYKKDVIHKWKFEADYFINFNNVFPRYGLIKEVIDYLDTLGYSERTQKLSLLEQIDDLEQRRMDVFLSVSLDNAFGRTFKKRIQLDDDYVEFLKLSVEQIKLYRDTGAIHSDFQNAWNEDMDRLNSFEKTPVAISRKKVWLSKQRRTPESVIETSEPYLAELLRLGQLFHPKNTGELQIGYEINRITVAYAKLNNWSKVIYWTNLFFGLDRHYRDRSSDGEQETIRKRLDRALRYLD
jgi:hypothetical protein